MKILTFQLPATTKLRKAISLAKAFLDRKALEASLIQKRIDEHKEKSIRNYGNFSRSIR
jgi:hypothetical protein